MISHLLGSSVISNLLSGLFGAIFGWLGTVYLQKRQEKAARKAAGRALLVELEINRRVATKLAAEIRKADALHEAQAAYSEIVWRQQLPLLAQFLKWKELQQVALGYLFWPG